MAERSKTSSGTLGSGNLRYVLVLLSAVLLLALTAVGTIGEVVGNYSKAEQATQNDVAVIENQKDGEGKEVESVTIAIDLEEGGAIDLQTGDGDVTIDTYDGDEVLLIVEKLPVTHPKARSSKPVNIQVTRTGRDVRIAALEYSGESMRGFDITYRLMVPRSTTLHYNTVKSQYDFSRLTGVLLRTLSREALNWIIR